MRIGFLCRDYPPAAKMGGIKIFTQTLARILETRGNYIVIISQENNLDDESRIDYDGSIRVFRFKKTPEFRPNILWQIWTRFQYQLKVSMIVSAERLDIIEAYDDDGAFLTKPKYPLVVRMHNNRLARKYEHGVPSTFREKIFVTRFLEFADQLIAVSESVGRKTLISANISDRHYKVIYNGIDTKVFCPNPEIIRDKNQILFVGEFIERKGLPVLFAALPKVFFRFPKVYIRCIGSDTFYKDAEMMMTDYCLRTLPEQYHCRVEFVPTQPHEKIFQEYQKAGLCVFPSNSEGLPLTVLEAMGCGAEVIYNADNVGPEMIDNGVDGYLCNTNDPDALANTIIIAIGSEQKEKLLGNQAVLKVKKKFDLYKILDQNIQIYREVLKLND